MSCCGGTNDHTHAEPVEGQMSCVGFEQDYVAMRDAKIEIIEVSLRGGRVSSVLTVKQKPATIKKANKK